jgi:hypothetical protein
MTKREKLRFSTNAKLGKLLGRELITNNIIAVFELIKNSYDAFANEVIIEFEAFNTSGQDDELKKNRNSVISSSQSKIIITDNGEGMTFKDIKEKWMEIGTTSKENIQTQTKSVNNRPQITRSINGEKGIGRFGADKLGGHLTMISSGNGGKEKSTLNLDWDLFDNHDKLIQDISFICDVENYNVTHGKKAGVTLKISELRDKWTGADILNLKKQLRKMLSPFSQEKDFFNIFLKFNGEHTEKIVNDSFDYANTGINMQLTKNGKMTYEIFDDAGTVRNGEALGVVPSFGPIKLKILYLDAAGKRSFSRRNGSAFREYGNVKLFRDNFRILPYGELENDWLGIDNKHAQAVFRSLGTRDIIGYVQITKKDNPALKDSTNRQGLNEDLKEFEEFKKCIWICLDILQNYIFDSIKKKAEQEGKVVKTAIGEISDDVMNFKTILAAKYESLPIPKEEKQNLVQSTLESFKAIEQNVEQIEKANKQMTDRFIVMEKIVGAEAILYDLLHSIKNKIDSLDALIRRLSLFARANNVKFEEVAFSKTVNEISSMVNMALNRTSPNRRIKRVVILSEVLENFISEKKLVYPNIHFTLERRNNHRIKCDVDGLMIMLDNFLSNSLKSFNKKEYQKIEISMKDVDNKVGFIFEDNGNGISDEIAPFIFNVSFTRTGGTGIGLSMAYHYMKEQDGDIEYLKNGNLGGAAFMVKFPVVRVGV